MRLLLGFEVDLSVIAEADDDMIARLAIDGSGSPAGDRVHASRRRRRSTPQGAPGRHLGRRGSSSSRPRSTAGRPSCSRPSFASGPRATLPCWPTPNATSVCSVRPNCSTTASEPGRSPRGPRGVSPVPSARGACARSWICLRRGSLSLLASDGHAHVDYTWSLAPLLEELRKRVPEDYLQTLVGAQSGARAGRQATPAGLSRQPPGRQVVVEEIERPAGRHGPSEAGRWVARSPDRGSPQPVRRPGVPRVRSARSATPRRLAPSPRAWPAAVASPRSPRPACWKR